MGGHLDVHSPSVPLIAGRHVGGGIAASDAADLGLPGVHRSLELVDASTGFCEALVGDRAAAVDGGDEAVGDGSCSVGEGVILHVEEGRS